MNTSKSFKNNKDLPNFNEQIIATDDNNEEWLILEAHPEWVEPKKIGEGNWDYPRKQLWAQIRSYLVEKKDYNTLKKWAIKQDFMGRWMPESKERYEIFSREYYWSSAYNHFLTDYYDRTKWRMIQERGGANITKVMVTTESFLWEAQSDHSKDEAIRFLKPCKSIYDGMNLKYNTKEGEFTDTTEKVQCFAANIYNNSKSYLLVKKNAFEEYLNENNLEIFWTVIGEKQIIGGGRFSDREFVGRLEFGSMFYFDDGKISGKIITKKLTKD